MLRLSRSRRREGIPMRKVSLPFSARKNRKPLPDFYGLLFFGSSEDFPGIMPKIFTDMHKTNPDEFFR